MRSHRAGSASAAGSQSLAAGPDGALWFTEIPLNKIGRMTADGDVTEFPIPTPGSGPVGIVRARRRALVRRRRRRQNRAHHARGKRDRIRDCRRTAPARRTSRSARTAPSGSPNTAPTGSDDFCPAANRGHRGGHGENVPSCPPRRSSPRRCIVPPRRIAPKRRSGSGSRRRRTIPAARHSTGRDMGFFAKAGLDVEVNVIGQGALIPDGMMSGSLDVGGINIPPVALAHERRLPFVMIAPGAVYESRSPTCALHRRQVLAHRHGPRPHREIDRRSRPDQSRLARGARLARPKRRRLEIGALRRAAGQRVVEAALQAGRIDAASIATPFLEKALRE